MYQSYVVFVLLFYQKLGRSRISSIAIPVGAGSPKYLTPNHKLSKPALPNIAISQDFGYFVGWGRVYKIYGFFLEISANPPLPAHEPAENE